MLDAMKASEVAHSLYRVRGDKAEADAARRIREYEDAGNTQEAESWRMIRAAIHQMRGPRAK